jgi:hypothetical protein
MDHYSVGEHESSHQNLGKSTRRSCTSTETAENLPSGVRCICTGAPTVPTRLTALATRGWKGMALGRSSSLGTFSLCHAAAPSARGDLAVRRAEARLDVEKEAAVPEEAREVVVQHGGCKQNPKP